MGAPWLPCPDTPWVKTAAVGNGGLTLMKISSALQVLHQRYRQMPSRLWEELLVRGFPPDQPPLPKTSRARAFRLDKALPRVYQTESVTLANDMFWGCQAARFVPEFRVPDWRTALGFAFEGCPAECFRLNIEQLAFGCHGLPRYNRRFWEP